MATDAINLTGIDANRPSSPALTRRALFGATGKAAAVAALADLPSIAGARPSRTTFDAATARLEAAERALETYARTVAECCYGGDPWKLSARWETTGAVVASHGGRQLESSIATKSDRPDHRTTRTPLKG